MNYRKIAEEYVKTLGYYDVVEELVVKNGFRYFRIDFTDRPRYTGHPKVIKISSAGKVFYITDLDEVHWALNESIKDEQ